MLIVSYLFGSIRTVGEISRLSGYEGKTLADHPRVDIACIANRRPDVCSLGRKPCAPTRRRLLRRLQAIDRPFLPDRGRRSRRWLEPNRRDGVDGSGWI